MKKGIFKGACLVTGTALLTYKITKHSIECRKAREHQEEIEERNRGLLDFLRYDKVTAEETAVLFGVPENTAREFLKLCVCKGIEL